MLSLSRNLRGRRPKTRRAPGATVIETMRSLARFVVRRVSWKPDTAKAAKTTMAGRTWKNAGCVVVVPTNRFVDAFPSNKANPRTGGRTALATGETRRRPIRDFAGRAVDARRAARRTTTARNNTKAAGARMSDRNGRSTTT